MHNFNAISRLINSSTRPKFNKKFRQECTRSVFLFEIHTVRPPPFWFVNDTLSSPPSLPHSHGPVTLSLFVRLTSTPTIEELLTLSNLLDPCFTESTCAMQGTKIHEQIYVERVKMKRDTAARTQSKVAEKWKRRREGEGRSRENYFWQPDLARVSTYPLCSSRRSSPCPDST